MIASQLPPDPDPLAHALQYAANGWPVVPIHAPAPRRPNGCTCSTEGCTQIGKHPRTAHGLYDGSADEAVVRKLWRQYPRSNVGIRTGAISGLVVLDVDGQHDGYASIAALEALHGPLPPTLTAATGSGGRHYFFSHPGFPVQNDASGKVGRGVDVRGEGGYVVAAPSLHHSGGTYRWEAAAPIAALPEGWLALLPRPKDPTLRVVPPTAPGDEDGDHWLDQALLRAQPGTRNHTGLWLACQLRDAGLDRQSAEGYLLRYAAHQGQDYTGAEAVHSLEQAFTRPPREKAMSQSPAAPLYIVSGGRRINTATGEIDPTPADEVPPRADAPGPVYEHTDLGNSDRFADAYRGELVYCRYGPVTGDWREWDGARWAVAPQDAVIARAGTTARAMYVQAADHLSTDAGKALAKHALRSQSDGKLTAMANLAKHELGTYAEQYDADPWLLNCANGTLDLRTGALRAHDPADRLTKVAGAAYHPDAACPGFDAFLLRVQPDAAMRTFIQRAIGYTLSGNTREQCLFFAYGLGSNGKSTLLTVLKTILGEYGIGAKPETFMVKKDDGGANNDVAALMGARGVIAGELEDGKRFAESALKAMTGTDMLTARFLHKEFFDFKPAFKLWLQGNHKPTIRGTDEGIWRRVRLVPFTQTITDEEKDRTIDDRLLAESPGILAWAVRGCLDWQRDGLAVPETVRAATAGYRREMDVLAAFLEECCATGGGLRCTRKSLYDAYRQWARDGEEYLMSSSLFGRRMAERGFDGPRTAADKVWIGIEVGTDRTTF